MLFSSTEYPATADIAVIGVPEEMGEQIKAVILPASGTEAEGALRGSLIAHVRECLAGSKVPRSLEFVDELPRTPTGKLVKSELVRRYRQPEASS